MGAYDDWYNQKYKDYTSATKDNYDKKNSKDTKAEFAQYATETANQAQQATQAKNQAAAQSLRNDSDQFKSNLPGYISGQTEAAGDQSRSNLTQDLANIKTSANARGLLYSGLNEGDQNQAKAYEGGKLAGKVKDINSKALSQSDYKNQLATNAEQGVDSQQLSYDQFQATQAQTSYEQALKEQQNQSSFFGDVFGAVTGIPGQVIALGTKMASKGG